MLLETIRRATAPSSIGESVEKEVEAAAVALLDLWADLVVHQPNLMDVFLKDATAGQYAQCMQYGLSRPRPLIPTPSPYKHVHTRVHTHSPAHIPPPTAFSAAHAPPADSIAD